MPANLEYCVSTIAKAKSEPGSCSTPSQAMLGVAKILTNFEEDVHREGKTLQKIYCSTSERKRKLNQQNMEATAGVPIDPMVWS